MAYYDKIDRAQILDYIDSIIVHEARKRMITESNQIDKNCKIYACIGNYKQIKSIISGNNRIRVIKDSDEGDNEIYPILYKGENGPRLISIPYKLYVDMSGQYFDLIDYPNAKYTIHDHLNLWIFYIASDVVNWLDEVYIKDYTKDVILDR